MDANLIAQTVAMIKAELGRPNSELLKAWTQSAAADSGLTAYSLEAPAKNLFPVLTPLRNLTPRKSGGTGIQANWRAVTGINTGNLSPGVAAGKRGGIVAHTTADYYAKFVGMGLEDTVDFEAQYAGVGFQDINATAVLNLLKALMLQEEYCILGGNGTAVDLGKPVTPTVTNVVSTAGSLKASQKYIVNVVALTLEGLRSSPAPGSTIVAGSTIPQSVARTNAGAYGGTTTYKGGSSIVSDPGNQTTAADGVNTHVVSAHTTAIPGAAAYAWFIGEDGGDIKLAAITSINSVILTAVGAATQKVADLTPAVDYSKNAYVFDGLLYQAFKTASGAYIKTMATGTDGTGTPLTAGTDGTIDEFDAALESLWNNYKLSPDTIWVSSQEMKYIRKKVLTTAATAAARFVFNADQGTLKGGTMVRSYLNPFTMGGAEEIDIKIHPNLPPGTVLMTTSQLPYPLSNVASVWQMLLRQDYYSIEWPLVQRTREYGTYFDGVLQHYFPPSMAVIHNIAAG